MAKSKDKKDKALRKELEAPDEFQVRAGQGLKLLRERRRLLLRGGLVTAVLIIAGVSYYYYYSVNREEAGLALTQATAIYTQPVDPAGVLTPTPPRPIEGRPPIQTFSSEEEKLAVARDEWKKVAAEHSGPAARAARLGEAATLFDLGQYAEAEAAYREFLTQTPEGSTSRALAQEGLGYALEANGDIPGAISAFQVLFQNESQGLLADTGRFHVARLYEKQGKTEEAIAAYKALLTDAPLLSFNRAQQDARQRLRALGVEPPPQINPALGLPLP